MLDSLADLDIELVVTLPKQFQKELGHVPDNTRMVEFVPLHVIIPSCSAVIHHGGIGPFLDSIAHQVPQLIVSRVLPDIGERGPRLERAGAGLWIPGDDPEGAGRLRDDLLAQPTPAQAVRELERLTDRYRSRSR
jgi:UDP:flavonoid glycosyltransferase YjiC (YdhE family)